MCWKPIVAFKRDSNYVPTNADGMRLMSDEQLANVLASVETGVNTYGDDVYSHWLSWLKSPAGSQEEGKAWLILNP